MKMKRYKNRILSLLIAFIATYIALYKVGNIGAIVAYTDSAYTPTIKLYVFTSIIFGIMSFILYSLFKRFFDEGIKKITNLAFLFLISFVFALLIAAGSGIGLYVYIGEYLRDIHRITIFTMDWSGFAITTTLFLTTILAYLFYLATKNKIKRNITTQ
jgi:hypothetical protein